MIVRRTALALCIVLAVPLFAAQPNPTERQRELIEQLLVLTHPEDAARRAVDTILEQLEKQFEVPEGAAPSDATGSALGEQKKDFARYRELMRDAIDYKKVVHDIYVPLYAKYFSEQQ